MDTIEKAGFITRFRYEEMKVSLSTIYKRISEQKTEVEEKYPPRNNKSANSLKKILCQR